MNRYYLTERPPMIGAMPKNGLKQVTDFGKKIVLPFGNNNVLACYGCVEYDRELTESEINNYELKKEGKEAIDFLKWEVIKFVKREYKETVGETYFVDLSRIPVASTNVEDHEEIIIEVAINVPELCLDMYINGKKCDTWAYETICVIALEIKNISFDELVEMGEGSEKRVNELLNKKGE